MAYSTFETYEAREWFLKGKIIVAQPVKTKDKLLVKSIAKNGDVQTSGINLTRMAGQEQCEFFVFDSVKEASQFLQVK